MAKDITFKRLLTYWPLYFFVLPSALMVATFSYFPAASAIYRSTYRWDTSYIQIFIGASNYQKALGSPLLWVMTLLVTMAMIFFSQRDTPFSKGLKLLCGAGFPLLLLGILSSEFTTELQPGRGGWLAPAFWFGLLGLLRWRLEKDHEHTGVVGFVLGYAGFSGLGLLAGLPTQAAWFLTTLVMGVLLWIPFGLFRRDTPMLKGMRICQALIGVGMMVWALAVHAGGDPALWSGFSVISVLVVANIVKMIPSISTAVVINRLKSDAANYWYRVLFVVPMIIPGMVYLLIWKFFFNSDGLFNLILRKSGIMHLLYLIDVWTENWVFMPELSATEVQARLEAGKAATWTLGEILAQAAQATPTWLGSEELVLPAFIIWGFPWVGVVGVLIYLAGLQSIDNSVYEAADLDGVGAFGKFLNIELPLILTQVRINLVLMIIGTLQMYGMILILFGPEGGPNGRMMVPGLLMFRSAFVERYAGYACSIGLILFFLILVLTEINNRFVRVEK
jgi:raffinose/stachyose/melibiose transport system permease protein